ncbi:MAG TPA: DNA methyltransferase, partial [Desulfobaccales bacterium]|nr:DNA methyltransferase [Desulfobaccales bacterium]
IKDYGISGQIGYGQSLHEYLRDLYQVWGKCFRVLRPGGRLCVNVGDQFARATVYGRYKIIPLHAEIITQGEELGFDFLGAIIWQKKTTMNTTGGATIMGSYPFPPNGLVEIDYEFILIFKKPGRSKKVDRETKEASRLTREEWKEYFAGHWRFGGARQAGHEAMFPEELPRRLIRMFTFRGDTVLDPFLGSGTTVKAALDLGRNAVGYEINPDYLEAIPEQIAGRDRLPFFGEIQIIMDHKTIEELPRIDYTPAIRDAAARPEAPAQSVNPADLPRVTQIIDAQTIRINDGPKVRFLGVKIDNQAEALDYLRNRILGKKVIIKDDYVIDSGVVAGYVYLKNRIFLNTYLIKSGWGSPDLSVNHKLRDKFIKLKAQTDGVNEGRKPQPASNPSAKNLLMADSAPRGGKARG